jgi:membrane fusion protein (multidrug efflux system)
MERMFMAKLDRELLATDGGARNFGSVAAVGCALLLFAGCAESKAKTPSAPPPPPAVQTVAVVRQDVPLFIEALGNLDGYVNADIRSRVRGILKAQRYKDGATVKEGQLLFTVDPAEFQIAADSAKAALARAETARAHARSLLARRQELGASRVVSQQEVEDAEAASRDADDQARVATAQLGQAKLNLSYTTIRSPVSGIAGLAQVRVGNLVGQDGPTLLTTVSQVDPIRVNFPLSEIDYVKAAERLKRLDGRDLAWAQKQFKRMAGAGTPGGGAQADGAVDDDAVELLLSDGTTYPHRGVIVAVNRQIDATTGTIQFQALFPNPENSLRPGQYGRVRMRRRESGANVLVVPEKALIQVQGTYSLAVVGAGHKVTLRRVEVGPAAGTLRIVASGVAEGEQVVVEGIQKVSDGVTVDPQPIADATRPAVAGAPGGQAQSPGASGAGTHPTTAR